jgi:hypothetical protein
MLTLTIKTDNVRDLTDISKHIIDNLDLFSAADADKVVVQPDFRRTNDQQAGYTMSHTKTVHFSFNR